MAQLVQTEQIDPPGAGDRLGQLLVIGGSTNSLFSLGASA